MKVFIIDDSSYVRVQLNNFLKEDGLSDITGFADYAKAEEECIKQKPDLILINIDPDIENSMIILDRLKENFNIIVLYHIGQGIEEIIENKYKNLKTLSKPISKNKLFILLKGSVTNFAETPNI